MNNRNLAAPRSEWLLASLASDAYQLMENPEARDALRKLAEDAHYHRWDEDGLPLVQQVIDTEAMAAAWIIEIVRASRFGNHQYTINLSTDPNPFDDLSLSSTVLKTHVDGLPEDQRSRIRHWIEVWQERFLSIKNNPVAQAAEYLASSLGQRDKWIYDARKAGTKNRQVIENLAKIFANRKWEHITTPQGIRNAVNRYCRMTGEPPPAIDKGGRPRSKNRKA